MSTGSPIVPGPADAVSPAAATPADAQGGQYLVISRGQWDADAPKEALEAAIDEFYAWLMRHIEEGRMKMGSRLHHSRAVVSREGTVTDGPYGEAKEIVGGYWFIVAPDLAAAAALAAENPCIRYGLSFEIRPLESERASAYRHANETPGPR
jgi:hypothetical protein